MNEHVTEIDTVLKTLTEQVEKMTKIIATEQAQNNKLTRINDRLLKENNRLLNENKELRTLLSK